MHEEQEIKALSLQNYLMTHITILIQAVSL